MKFKIHRGTQEIGGSCVEVWTESTRILLDFGMPLVEKNGSEFDFQKYMGLTAGELVARGVLPNINGLYDNKETAVDGVIFSHAHQDHFGLANFISEDIPYFLGAATHKIIELNNLFTLQIIQLKKVNYFKKEEAFNIGDISVTPYWADHSAFDSYSFFVEANGKSIFYSGDFRSHGRKSKAFYWFTNNAPQNVDYMLLEGTNVCRPNKQPRTESQIEDDLVEVFQEEGKINLVYSSGQNIDRLTSVYRACTRTGKILVVDVYVAKVLTELSQYAAIPYPSDNFKNIRVMFPYYTGRRLTKNGNENVLYQFKRFKITKEEISLHSEKIIMTVRPSMQKDLEYIYNIDGGNLIYSMWEGYLEKVHTKDFINYLTNRGFNIHKIHTSGHADTDTLKKLVNAIKPKNIVPIHTFAGDKYDGIFDATVAELQDGEIIEV